MRCCAGAVQIILSPGFFINDSCMMGNPYQVLEVVFQGAEISFSS